MAAIVSVWDQAWCQFVPAALLGHRDLNGNRDRKQGEDVQNS